MSISVVDIIIIQEESHFKSGVVSSSKNAGKSLDDPEAWRFLIPYRMLNASTQYPQFPITVIYDIFGNITTDKFISTINFTTCYFQVALNPYAKLRLSLV